MWKTRSRGGEVRGTKRTRFYCTRGRGANDIRFLYFSYGIGNLLTVFFFVVGHSRTLPCANKQHRVSYSLYGLLLPRLFPGYSRSPWSSHTHFISTRSPSAHTPPVLVSHTPSITFNRLLFALFLFFLPRSFTITVLTTPESSNHERVPVHSLSSYPQSTLLNPNALRLLHVRFYLLSTPLSVYCKRSQTRLRSSAALAHCLSSP